MLTDPARSAHQFHLHTPNSQSRPNLRGLLSSVKQSDPVAGIPTSVTSRILSSSTNWFSNQGQSINGPSDLHSLDYQHVTAEVKTLEFIAHRNPERQTPEGRR